MSREVVLAVALSIVGCARGAALETDAGGTAEAGAADAPAQMGDRPAIIPDLGPDRGAGDAADSRTVCEQACGWLIEPCTRYTPPQAPVCLEACLKRSDTELACAWAALNGGIPDVSQQCAELARCLGLP